MAQPKRVGHLVLNVSDVEASEKFYTEVLGFQISSKRPTATFLTCGKIHHDLALFKTEDDAGPFRKGQVGLNHFAVQIEDMDALQDIYHRLKKHGVEISRTIDHGMTNSVYFSDPDGIELEFFCNSTQTTEEGLAIMGAAGRQNKELALEDVAAS